MPKFPSLPFITDVRNSEEPSTQEAARLPKYDYEKHVPKYHKYRKNGTLFDTTFTTEDNIQRALALILSGREKCGKKETDMRMGDRTFFQSGTCGPESEPACVNKPRSIIVDNVPSGKFEKRTDYDASGRETVGNNGGLIPGILEDIVSLNPGEFLL